MTRSVSARPVPFLLSGVLLAAALAALPGSPAAAQLSWGGSPISQLVALPSVVPTVAMVPVDVGALLEEDLVASKDQPFRFGATLPVDFGLANAGVWDVLANGDRVWRLRISSPGAYSLSLLFGSYQLPGGSSLFVYNDDGSHVLGAYDDRNNKADGEFSIEPVAGDAITLEYIEPAPVAGQGLLQIMAVVHDYRDIFALIKGTESGPGDAAGACNIDVNCPQGAPWVNQNRAVTLLLIGGTLCTGALINNAANDGTQYYISAHHCGGLNNAIFRFGYEKSGCGSGSAPTNKTVQGSTEMAGSSSLDFRLVRLNTAIPSSYAPYYLGWDRSSSAIPTNTLTIHHPQGDVKKISFDNNAPGKSGSQWQIFQWDLGVTEPGSSGCPLMNQNGRFIGQLCCGSATCSFLFNDFYGRFDPAWNTVKTFLDPANTGVVAIDGFDPSAPGTPPVLASVSPGAVQALLGGTITLTGSGFNTATQVTSGGTVLTTPGLGFQIVNDTTITYGAPTATTLGTTSVTVSNGSGTSAAKTFNYVETNPPKLSASGLAFNGNPFTWTWGGGSSDTSYLYFSLTNTTFNYSGFPLLTSMTFLDIRVLPANGIGSLVLNIPVGTSGLFFYSQVATLDGGTGNFVGASSVVSTLIL